MPPVGLEFGAPVLPVSSLERLFSETPNESVAYLDKLTKTYDREKLVALVLNLGVVCVSFATKVSPPVNEEQERK